MTDAPILNTGQIVTLALFLLALGGVWLAVHWNRTGLSRRLHQGRRLRVAEVAGLGPGDRAILLEVDGTPFLVLRCRGAAPVVQPLPAPAPAAAPAAAGGQP